MFTNIDTLRSSPIWKSIHGQQCYSIIIGIIFLCD